MQKKFVGFVAGFILASLPYFSLAATSRIISADVTEGFSSTQNVLSNASFETGTFGLTASGGSLSSASGSMSAGTVRRGDKAVDWDSSAAAQTLSFAAKTFPAGNNQAWVWAKCASGTCTHLLELYDGSNVVASAPIISDASNFVLTSFNFALSAPTSLTLRLKSVASNEPSIRVDDAYGGQAINLGLVSQARLYGTLRYAATANCTWTTTSATYVSFSADTDCATPVVTGNATAPGTKIPAIVFPTLEPGDYLVMMTGRSGHTTSGVGAMRLTDGTTRKGFSYLFASTNADTGTQLLSAFYSYPNGGSNITFQPQAFSNDGNTTFLAANAPSFEDDLEFQVYKFPTGQQLSATFDQYGTAWAGYHDHTCAWSRTNTAMGDPTADATCTFTETKNRNFGTVTSYLSGSDKLPGLVWTPKKANNLYYICAKPTVTGSVNNENISFQLTDGSTVVSREYVRSGNINASSFYPYSLCGLWESSNTNPVTHRIECQSGSGTCYIDVNNQTGHRAVEWSIFDLSSFGAASFSGVPVSSDPAPRHEWAYITVSGSTPVISRQSGNWVASLTDNGSGDTSLNLTASKFSVMGACQLTLLEGASDAKIAFVSDPTTSLARVQTRTTAGLALDNQSFYISCDGTR